jgi:hypothetical protein
MKICGYDHENTGFMKGWNFLEYYDCLNTCTYELQYDKIRDVTIRQKIGLEETIIKEIEQNQLIWYGHVQRMAEGRLRKIALKWMPKERRAQGRPKKNRMEGTKMAMHERNQMKVSGKIGCKGV